MNRSRCFNLFRSPRLQIAIFEGRPPPPKIVFFDFGGIRGGRVAAPESPVVPSAPVGARQENLSVGKHPALASPESPGQVLRAIQLLFLLTLLLLSACAPAAEILPTPLPAAATAPPATSTPAPAPIPTASPTTAPSGCAEPGSVRSLSLQSAHLPEPLFVYLYLPPCYDPRPAQPYPLLILLHGQGADAEEWQRLGITTAADRLTAAKTIPPMLIAMPYERRTLENPFESGFDDALLEDLLPHLEENFAVCRERACRALGGLSRGAAWALHIGLSNPGLFAALGAHSYPAFYGDFNRLPLLLREIEPDQMPRIWMDTGERDRYLAQATQYHELLIQYDVAHEWQLFPGEHNEAYWSAHVEEYLRWYAAAVVN